MAQISKQDLKKLAVVVHDLVMTALAIWLVFVIRFEGWQLTQHNIGNRTDLQRTISADAVLVGVHNFESEITRRAPGRPTSPLRTPAPMCCSARNIRRR